MILEFDSDTRKLFATLPATETSERYECGFSACLDPTCTCHIVHMKFFPVDGDEARTTYEGGCQFAIDIKVNEKAIAPEFEKNGSEQDLEFAQRFLNGLSLQDCHLLSEQYFKFKNAMTKQAKPDEIDAWFNYDAIDSRSQMQIYNDILPFGDRQFLLINDEEHILFDQYCIKGKCGCTAAYIEIRPVDEIDEMERACPTVRVDYKTRKWEIVEHISDGDEIAATRRLIEEQIPDFYQRLAERHARLKAIYAHNRKRHFNSLPKEPIFAKIARNAPCPCGSGKKFKKCCLN